MGHPTIYPIGVTIYDKTAAWNGYTVFQSPKGMRVIDMNGREISVPSSFFPKSGIFVEEKRINKPEICGKPLLDSKIVQKDGEKTIWEWLPSDHFDEFGFDEAAKSTLYRLPAAERAHGGDGLWLDIQSPCALGANKWHDAGDERFKPENIIWSARNANILGITDKKTGKIVWRLGPDWISGTTHFGAIIGASHVAMIPKGFPGEGNILIFDSGGEAGYGAPHDAVMYGTGSLRRDYSRVLEIQPARCGQCSTESAYSAQYDRRPVEPEWQYTPKEAGHIHPLDSYKFYSPTKGSAVRLANGNTLICEGSSGRILEVTPAHKTVWEYIAPDSISGVYRVGYETLPGAQKPDEIAVPLVNVSRYRTPGAPLGPGGKITIVKTVDPNRTKPVDDPNTAVLSSANEPSNFCVINSGNDS